MDRQFVGAVLSLSVLLMLSGCMPPERPLPADAGITSPDGWREDNETGTGQALNADWWRNFNDPALERLIEQALARNTDVLTAASRVEEAQARIGLSRAGQLPSIDASVEASRARTYSVGIASIGSTAQPGVNIAWQADLWQRLSNLTEAARLNYMASRTERDAMALTVAATTARSYIGLLSLDAQLTVSRNTLESRREALRIARSRAETGYTSQLELTQAQAEYEATAALVPQLEQAIREQENALRLLTGELPGNIARNRSIADLSPPGIPTLLPSELLTRRPDIVQSELQLAAADENLAAARKAFLPQVQLSANGSRLFSSQIDDPVSLWSLGGSILAPIFSGGQLTAEANIATAQRDQAAYNYRGTVLNAFEEVENAMSATERLAEQFNWLKAQESTLTETLKHARNRYRAGYASYLDELDAQRNLLDAQLNAIQIREQQLSNVVTLYEAMGGGWTKALDDVSFTSAIGR